MASSRNRRNPARLSVRFDPEKIKVRTINVVVDQIVSRIDHDEIDLAPEFQRKVGIWKDRQKSRLIESLLLRIPIPVFYVAADVNETWSVVDGVQRDVDNLRLHEGRFLLDSARVSDESWKAAHTLNFRGRCKGESARHNSS